jgi:hypothetical protein
MLLIPAGSLAFVVSLLSIGTLTLFEIFKIPFYICEETAHYFLENDYHRSDYLSKAEKYIFQYSVELGFLGLSSAIISSVGLFPLCMWKTNRYFYKKYKSSVKIQDETIFKNNKVCVSNM